MAGKLKISPIRRAVVPAYPDQYSVDLKPFLLDNKPLRWQAKSVAGTVLSAVVLLGLAGCASKEYATMGEPVQIPPVDERTPAPLAGGEYVTLGYAPQPTPFEEKTPLFKHGKGIGVYGCVAVAAPVFLSEDDAFVILREEFEKLGLSVEKSDKVLTDIELPVMSLSPGLEQANNLLGKQRGDLQLDFAVEGKRVWVEFVSQSDVREWGTENNVTVDIYNMKSAAQVINDSLNAVGDNGCYGVLYDPAATTGEYDFNPEAKAPQKSWEELKAEAHAKAVEELRAQIIDFIAWLSAQGII